MTLHDVRRAALPSAHALDRDKLERLVHHAIWIVGARDGLDTTELGVILWSVDAFSYVHRGKPITGATYVRAENGPASAGVAAALRDLQQKGDLRLRPLGRTELAVASRAADMSLFDSTELSVIDDCMSRTAAGVPDDRARAWRTAELGENIPMTASLAVLIRKADADDVQWGKQVATKLSLP